MEDASATSPHVTKTCGCGRQSAARKRAMQWATAGSVLAALGVRAACCLLPFALLSVGVAGAWVSGLDAVAPYKCIFIVATAALLGYGFWSVYWKPKRACAAGAACGICGSGRPVGIGLWIATIPAISGVVFGYL